jgi:hypothetical protein
MRLFTWVSHVKEHRARQSKSGEKATALPWGHSTPGRGIACGPSDQTRFWRRRAIKASSRPLRPIQPIENAATRPASRSTRPSRKFPNGRLKDVQGGFVIRHSRLTALGIMLCLLAALFALEAKIAWFSPAGSTSAQISSDKARPAEPPKALPLRFVSPAPLAHDFAGTATLFAVTLLASVIAAMVVRQIPPRPQVAASPGFSPSLFFRPPPVR